MADNKTISLKLCGNQFSNSGFMPLALFNSPLFEVPDVEYGGFAANSYFFSVKIENSQVVYTLIKNNVRSSNGAFREGSLKIAISVPKGYRIALGKTPFDALLRIKDVFMANCMICRDSLKGVYEFTNERINPNVLDDVAREFTLEEAPGPYHPMKVGAPKGFVTMSEAEMSLFFKDVQYVEFSAFSEILIASIVQNSNYTPVLNLQIPRKNRFRIIIDGVVDGYVDDVNEVFTVKGRKNSKFYDNHSLELSIAELRNGRVFPDVHLDEENEVLLINTSGLSEPKCETINIVFDQDVEGYFHTFSKSFALYYRKKSIPVKDFSFTLIGDELSMLDSPSGFSPSFSKTDTFIITGGNLTVNPSGKYEYKINTKKVETPQQFSDVGIKQNAYKIDLCLPCRPIGNIVSVCDRDNEILSIRVDFISFDDQYKGEIYIPSRYDLNALQLRYETSESIFTSRFRLDKMNNVYVTTGFYEQKKTFWQSKIKPHKEFYAYLVGMILGFVLGSVLAYFTTPYIHKLLNRQPKETQQQLCPDCGISYDTQEQLQIHQFEAHPKYHCPYERCEMEYKTKDQLVKHIESSHIPKRAPTTSTPSRSESAASPKASAGRASASKKSCAICGTKVDTDDDLYQHMFKIHKHYTCPYCGVNTHFDSQGELNRHMRHHHSDKERIIYE